MANKWTYRFKIFKRFNEIFDFIIKIMWACLLIKWLTEGVNIHDYVH
jgi:hypothetical protein